MECSKAYGKDGAKAGDYIEDANGDEDVEVELLEADEEENGKLSGSRRIEGSSTEDKSLSQFR